MCILISLILLVNVAKSPKRKKQTASDTTCRGVVIARQNRLPSPPFVACSLELSYLPSFQTRVHSPSQLHV